MLSQYMHKELNPYVNMIRINPSAYNSGDLSSYYSDTLAVLETEHGLEPVKLHVSESSYFVVRLDDQDDGSSFSGSDSTLKEESLPKQGTVLYAVNFPQGFYLKDNKLYKLENFTGERSYKKSCRPGQFEIREARRNSQRVFRNVDRLLSFLYSVMYPEQSDRYGNRVISPRLAMYKGELLTFHQNFRIGSYKDELVTPFECVQQRIEQSSLREVIRCRVQEI